ncbi:MAG TPA: OmpH family outer membrane protein [Chitinophagaceae bacterium]|nr:OmpH family outer membrane protein [Chitinophagaceae bacterium]
MKNGLLIWNVLLTVVAGYLLILHFRPGKTHASPSQQVHNDTFSVNKDFRIAYFEMDSVEANFEMVKDVKAELSKKEDAITVELDGLSRRFQQRYKYFQEQAQGGTMTQAQSDQAGAELKNLDEQIKSRKQNLDQEYSEFVMKRMKDVKMTIKDFLRDYNKTRNFSYIVSYGEADGLFYYKDSAYNITAEVIKGLNALYKPASKKQ